MKIYKQADLEAIRMGDILLLYGASGVGKTVTCLQTAPDPIFHFMTEPRNPLKMLHAADRPGVDIEFGLYTDWDDMFDHFADPENVKRYATIIIDSITFLSNVCLNFELTEESYESRSDAEKLKSGKQLINRTKLSMEGFGGLSGQMLRFTNMISKLSQDGKVIILLALLEQNPKFNRELVGAPALKGRDYPKNLPGFMDFIGLIEERIDNNGLTVFPPRVNFRSDGGYLAKWTGYGAAGAGPLNIQKILDKAHGRDRKGETTED